MGNPEIKNRWTEKIIIEANKYASIKKAIENNKANLGEANLRGANLWGANLWEANLRRANLWGANLRGADLGEANLCGANLWGADLGEANLCGARGIGPYMCTPLLMLYDQPGKIRAYKLINSKNEGPYQGGIIYKRGETYKVNKFNTNPNMQCAEGINLATLDWCIKNWQKGYKILIAEFTAEDIACIPTATDGKFRVKKCTIVGRKTLKELGLSK